MERGPYLKDFQGPVGAVDGTGGRAEIVVELGHGDQVATDLDIALRMGGFRVVVMVRDL